MEGAANDEHHRGLGPHKCMPTYPMPYFVVPSIMAQCSFKLIMLLESKREQFWHRDFRRTSKFNRGVERKTT